MAVLFLWLKGAYFRVVIHDVINHRIRQRFYYTYEIMLLGCVLQVWGCILVKTTRGDYTMTFDMFLNFNGDCRDALDFYARVFDLATPTHIMTYEQAPGGGLGDENAGRILYSTLPIFGRNVMFSDCPAGSGYVKGTNVTLTINSDDKGELQRLFDSLADGGKVEMPLEKTFFSEFFGSVTDRFGVSWNLDLCEQKALYVYLAFDGDCRAALGFYAKAFGLDFPDVMTFEQDPDGGVAKEDEGRIMHAELPVFGGRLMVSDCPSGSVFVKGTNIAITLGASDKGEIERVFTALADGGNVAMPIGKTFFSELYGMLTDKFGVIWQLAA